jgi:hypothetical protein
MRTSELKAANKVPSDADVIGTFVPILGTEFRAPALSWANRNIALCFNQGGTTMKKLITAAALAAFAIASTTAMAEDTKPNAATQKTPTQQQMDTKAKDGAMAPAGTTTGAASNATVKPGDSKVPGKPTDAVKDAKQ